MKKNRGGVIVCWLCLWAMGPVFAQTLEGHWEGQGLITQLELAHNGNDGSITLSDIVIDTLETFSADRAELHRLHYKVPVKVLITVDEAAQTTQTMILNCENFVYNIVLRYDPHKNQFEVIWFDRHDLEVPIKQQFLR